jgi:glycosyltransferase involved in cell wall biosynthesis
MLDVILCTYNSENTINKCVDSILNQTFTDFTLHIFDDSSNDSTIELLKKYKDTRLRIIRSPKNVGTYAGKNYILRNFCNHKFIALHDSDDWSEKERFEKQINFMLDKEVVCVGTAVKEFNKNSDSHTVSNNSFVKNTRINTYDYEITNEILLDAKNSLLYDYNNYLKLKFCMNGTIMLTHKILRELGGWDAQTRIAADTDLFLRILSKHSIYNLQEQLYCRTFHNKSLTATKEFGINSDIRQKYNIARLPMIDLAIQGKAVKRHFEYPNLEYKEIK